MLNSRGDAKLLRIHLSEGDRRQGRKTYEAILQRCQEAGIAGATVFRGLEGFGETAEIHRRHLLHPDQPIVILVVDEAAKITALIPEIEGLMESGMLALSDVTARRVVRQAPAGGDALA